MGPWAGIEPVTPCIESQSLNHWTTREVPRGLDYLKHSMFEDGAEDEATTRFGNEPRVQWNVRLVTTMVFPVVMYGCESWTLNAAEHQRIDAFWTVVLEKTLESPLDCKEVQPVHPKGNQSWIFSEKTNADGEAPILWPPHVKNWLIWKDPAAGKDWRWEEKGTTEHEMVGWHHWLNGHEFE